MFASFAIVVLSVAGYLLGRVHGHEAAKATEGRFHESTIAELKELRKWKADHIGKEKA